MSDEPFASLRYIKMGVQVLRITKLCGVTSSERTVILIFIAVSTLSETEHSKAFLKRALINPKPHITPDVRKM